MTIKEYFKSMMKQLGFIILTAWGFAFFIFGILEQIVWAVILGFLIIDLTPSFIITTWKTAGERYWGKRK